MWFRIFLVIRLPVSLSFLVGYYIALSIWKPGMELFGAAFVLGAYIFLAVVTIMLFRRRKSALRLTYWLLALETIGAILLESVGAPASTHEPLGPFVTACVVIAFWVLPNEAIFYKQRAKFAELEKQKPGL